MYAQYWRNTVVAQYYIQRNNKHKQSQQSQKNPYGTYLHSLGPALVVSNAALHEAAGGAGEETTTATAVSLRRQVAHVDA